MPDTSKAPGKKDIASEVRVVVEVDGNPVGFLQLDAERLWPLINHRKNEDVPVEWIDAARFDSVVRAAVVKRLMTRLEQHLYRTLGDEIVKAQLDVEAFTLKVEAAALTFGRSTSDIEQFVQESGRTTMDFYTFFWDCLLDDRDTLDLKKEWKAARNRPQ